MNAALRLPVTQVSADLILGNGSAHSVRMYVPAGQSIEDVLASSSTFIPATERDEFRLIARAAIACVTVASAAGVEAGNDLPLERREVRVFLTSGQALEGHLQFLPSVLRNRTADHLNDASDLFQLFGRRCRHYIAKRHVSYVEELS